jgi:steroid delta-isomerase-like uncharacterized protein
MKNMNIIFQKALIAFFSCCFCFAAAQTKTSTKDIAIQWIELLNKHDTVTLSALYSSTAQITSPNWEGKKSGRDEIRQVYSRYFTSTPDLQHVISNIIATDTTVTMEYNFSGTLKTPEKNTPEYMRGKKYSLDACTIMTIHDGRITKQQTYFDQVAFLRQVGFFEHSTN